MRSGASYTEPVPRTSSIRRCAVLALVVLGASCDDDYPLEPTFCDDWCRVTLRSGCNEEPENCVRDCELTKASDECFARQRELANCYGKASPEAFVCAGSGFDEQTRVEPEVCRTERDALYECEAPGIGTCLSVCRATQAAQLETAYDSATGLVDFQKLASDGGAGDACPAIDQPCEALCFSIVGFSSAALDVALDEPTAGGDDAGGFDPEATRRCIEEALLTCIFGEPGNGDVSETPGDRAVTGPSRADSGIESASSALDSDDSMEESRVETISDVLAQCAAL